MRLQQQMTSDITTALARFAAELHFAALPAGVVEMTKRLLLDTLGTTLAANTLGAGCRELIAFARIAGGAPECVLLGAGERAPATTAALVNGGMAHALNYDAVGAGHLGLIPVAPLAAAERCGTTGRELIAAIAAGCEVAARTALAVRRPNEAALAGQVLSYFGAAAGAGRALRLDTAKMASAFGLALMQTAGAREVSVVGGEPPAKAIYGAFPSHGGMLAALLAELGLGAACEAFEGQAGLYALYYDGDFGAETLVGALGEQYRFMSASFKPWAASGVVNPFIEAALDLVHRHAVQPDHIAHVEICGGSRARRWMEPAAERRRPSNAAAAANSVYFAVAKALANGAVALADFTPEGLRQPQALKIADRTEHAIDETLGSSALVTVTLRSGAELNSRVDQPLGSPTRPIGWPELVQKFRDCAGHASHPLPPASLERAIGQIEHLEELPDVRTLTAILC